MQRLQPTFYNDYKWNKNFKNYNMKWKKPRFLLTDEWIKRCYIYIQWNITHITHKMEHI